MKTIIVADDDPAIREIFRLILERAGYAVTLYHNGDVLMNNEFDIPDLFIIDRQLSGIDGLDICRHLKQNASTENIPVIITSASPQAAALAIKAGANDFVEKPFKTKDFINAIERYIGK